MSSVNVKKRITDLLTGSLATNGYYGFPDLASNTDDIISEIYISPTYSDQERIDLATWFSSTTITILPEYPRTVAQLPSIFVFRTSDSEDDKGILGDIYDIDSSGDFTETVTRGTYLVETVDLNVWAQGDGAMRDDIYLALREILMRGMDYLHLAGVEIPEWKNGSDGQMFREEMRPHVIHTAKSSIKYRIPVTWDESSAKIKSIRTNAEGYEDGKVTASSFRDDR